jgi:hypothetical protein
MEPCAELGGLGEKDAAMIAVRTSSTPYALALGLIVAAMPSAPAQALCMASGDGCGDSTKSARFVGPKRASAPPFEVGQPLPARYQMLTNTAYYGLEPPRDGWVYVRVDRWLFRMDLATRRILEDVTSSANAAF